MKKLSVFLFLLLAFFVARSQPSWQPLPGGPLNAPAKSIIRFGNWIWVFGSFTQAGSLAVTYVVRCTGAGNYQGAGILPEAPECSLVKDDSLFIGGHFLMNNIHYGILYWNENTDTWDPYATIASTGKIRTMTLYQNKITFAGQKVDSINNVYVKNFGQINNGITSEMPIQIQGCLNCNPAAIKVSKLFSKNNYLYIGGLMDSINNRHVSNCAVWDGVEIHPMPVEANRNVFDFCGKGDTVFAVGNYRQATVFSPGIMKTVDSIWLPVKGGLYMAGISTATNGSRVYVGGSYTTVGIPPVSNPDNIDNLGYWDGQNFQVQSQGLFATGAEEIDLLYYDPIQTTFYASGFFRIQDGNVAGFIAYQPEGSTLPTKLISFNGVEAGGKVKLSWKVENNGETADFVIEKSIQNNQFVSIGQIPNDQTKYEYTYIDQQPASINYYRIKLPNGKYSPVIRVSLGKKQEPTFQTLGQGRVYISNITPGSSVSVYLSDGRIVYQKIVGSHEEIKLPFGQKFIRIITPNGQLTTKNIIF